MQKKNFEISNLIDFYGDLLTFKQKDVLDLFYNKDLTLSEIAENQGISRQAVSDRVGNAEVKILGMEARVGFFKYYSELQKKLSIMHAYVNQIKSVTANKEIIKLTQSIEQVLKEISHLNERRCMT